MLDANQNIVSKAALFRAAWQAYPNIEYRGVEQGREGRSRRARGRRPEFGDKVKYDVINLIPPQRAGTIAVQADLVGADKRWCEVDHVTYESVKHKNIHVIGDSTTGLPVPKSGNDRQRHGQDLRGRGRAACSTGKPAPAMPPLATPATAG